MDAQKIYEKLKEIKSKKDIQEFFIDLNFDYSQNSNINLIDNFQIPLNLREKIDSINLINEYKSFNIFYCKLKAENLYRNRALQRDIAKKISRTQDCIIIFANNNENIFRITYADFLQGTPGQIKLSGYTISGDEKLRTASEQLSKIEIQADISVLELVNKIKKSFEIEPVTEEFFRTIKRYIDNLSETYEKYFRNKHKTKAFALQFFNRLLFLKYIEKKKWLNRNVNFLSELLEKYNAINQLKNNISNNDSIYQNLLKPLFFYAFSKNRSYYPKDLPKSLIKDFENLPFLNGGLFEKNELDLDEIIITDEIINGVFKDILNKYNFTVTEATPLDIEIAIDPEMLGLIYEGIVNEDERSGSGIFYTPRVEVDFMCKKSLLHFLLNNTNISQDKLIDLIFGEASETDIIPITKIGERVSKRIQEIHNFFGEDGKYLDDREILNEKDMYAIYDKRDENILDEEEFIFNEAEGIIRKLMRENPDLYEKIKNMPDNLRCIRKAKDNNQDAKFVIFCKKANSYSFYVLNGEGNLITQNDDEALKILKAEPDEVGLSELPKGTNKIIQNTFNEFKEKMKRIELEHEKRFTSKSTEQSYILNILKHEMDNLNIFSDEYENRKNKLNELYAVYEKTLPTAVIRRLRKLKKDKIEGKELESALIRIKNDYELTKEERIFEPEKEIPKIICSEVFKNI